MEDERGGREGGEEVGGEYMVVERRGGTKWREEKWGRAGEGCLPRGEAGVSLQLEQATRPLHSASLLLHLRVNRASYPPSPHHHLPTSLPTNHHGTCRHPTTSLLRLHVYSCDNASAPRLLLLSCHYWYLVYQYCPAILVARLPTLSCHKSYQV